jgi:hypothetical protein
MSWSWDEDRYFSLIERAEGEFREIQRQQAKTNKHLAEIRSALVMVAMIIAGFGFHFAGAF